MPELPTIFCHIAYLAETRENRRLPRMTWRVLVLLASRTEPLGWKIALGNSREPPAFTFQGRTRETA